MRTCRVLFTTVLVVLISIIGVSPGGAAPGGQTTWAVHVSLPRLVRPSRASGIITPWMIIYVPDGTVADASDEMSD